MSNETLWRHRRNDQPPRTIYIDLLEPRRLLTGDDFSEVDVRLTDSAPALTVEAGELQPFLASTAEADVRIPTTTYLSSLWPVVAWHSATTFTARVLVATTQSAPTSGTVTFFEGNNRLHTAPLVDGAATWTTTLLPGLHQIHARYNGGVDHAISTSAPVTQLVTGTAVTIVATATPATVRPGQPVTIHVQVNNADSGQPVETTPRVTLRLNDTFISYSDLTAYGTTALQYTPSTAGDYTFTLDVEANHRYYAGSAPVTVTAERASVNASLIMYYDSADYGRRLPAIATFRDSDGFAPWSGTMQIRNAVTGEVYATSGVYQWWDAVLLPPPGQHQLRAEFLGSNAHDPAVSDPVTITIHPTPTTMRFEVLDDDPHASPPILSAKIQRSAPSGGLPESLFVPITGRVAFKLDGDVIANVEVVNGAATYAVPQEYMGRIGTFTAIYHGDGIGFQPSKAPRIRSDMRRESSAYWVTRNIVGEQAKRTRLEVSVYAPTGNPVNSGTVEFFPVSSGRNVIATATVVNGRAIAKTKLPPGIYELAAVFVGSATHIDAGAGVEPVWIHHHTRVDLMIAYTDEAAGSVGGIEQLKAIALEAVEQTNRALYNSDIPVTVRLVRLVEVDYQETGNYNTELKRLSTKADGFLDTLHTERNKYGADLVSLFVGREGADATIGLAYRMAAASTTEAPFGFSVIMASEANGSQYTLAHELGHNFGASHDTANSPAGDSLIAPYAHGHRFWVNTTVFRDLMSYPPGKPILHFANPRVTHKGIPTGNHQTADLARLFTTTAPYIARYRDERVMFGNEQI